MGWIGRLAAAKPLQSFMTAPQGFPAYCSNDHRALSKCLNRKGSEILDVPERFGDASTALSREALDRGGTRRSIMLDLTLVSSYDRPPSSRTVAGLPLPISGHS